MLYQKGKKVPYQDAQKIITYVNGLKDLICYFRYDVHPQTMDDDTRNLVGDVYRKIDGNMYIKNQPISAQAKETG
jgi:hypothetical protein